MLPDDQTIHVLWDKYGVPDLKRDHLLAVTRVADYLSKALIMHGYSVDTPLVHAAALLHDIDKAAPKNPGEKHPDAAVRILKDEGYPQIAELVKRHSLHTILDPDLAPKTIEEKLLYLSDKMAKYEIITVDERFNLWRAEKDMPDEGKQILVRSYPLVKELELEILSKAGVKAEDLASLA